MIVELVGGSFVDLSLLPVQGFAIGTTITDTDGATYRLAESTEVVDHSLYESVFGEPSLRWIKQGVLSLADLAKLSSVPSGSLIALNAISEEMDLVNGAGTFYSMIPACPFYMVRLVSPSAWITVVGGTRSVVGTFQSGSNSAADDYGTAANFNAAFLTQEANTLATLNINTVTPVPVLDLTTNGFRLKVATAMTGTAPVCKARATAIVLLRAV